MNLIQWGALLSGIGVILGAFGAHGLQGKVTPDLLEIFKTGTHYWMIHSIALVLYGLSGTEKTWPAWCFALGILIFSGSLFGITFTGIRVLGAITPIGGLLFIAGWFGFALLAKR